MMRLPCYLLLIILAAFSAYGADYFVSIDGSDQANGQSWEDAFATIQQGVDALAPGDTLTIGPGDYHEQVTRDQLGDESAETVIRAAIPGTVVVRNDEPLPGFTRVDGYRFVLAASLAEPPVKVLEPGSRTVLQRKPNAREVEMAPGSFAYDEAAGRLYVSSATFDLAAGRLFTIVRGSGSCFILRQPTRVRIEGLAMSGGHSAAANAVGRWARWPWGLLLDEPRDCTIRDCTAYLNSGGIAIVNGSGNIVENCRAYGNAGTNIGIFGGDRNRDNVVRDSLVFEGSNGIHVYGKLHGPVLLSRNIAWGHHLDYSIKTGTESGARFGAAEHCVGLSNWRINNLRQCLIGGSNEYRRDIPTPIDNIVLQDQEELVMDAEFAAPLNLDFRLQADSRFRQAGWANRDRGVFPEFDDHVTYVSPDGDDSADGRSLRQAWRTLARAVRSLQPGGVIYLSAGTYQSPGTIASVGAADRPIALRGRGHGEVVIEGDVALTDVTGLSCEGLTFTGRVEVRQSQHVAFDSCSLEQGMQVQDVAGLRVEHSRFGGTLRLQMLAGLILRGNWFQRSPAVELGPDVRVTYADHNGYASSQDLAAMRPQHDRYSMVMPAAAEPSVLAGRGPLGMELGPRRLYKEKTPILEGPHLHSVTSTTANIEWWTSVPTDCELAWGTTPEMTERATLKGVYRFSTFSLRDLEPDTTYFFQVRSLTAGDQTVTFGPEQTFALRTAEADAPPVDLYVAIDGDDANSGLSRQEALRTINAAATKVRPGGTIWIGGGTYHETVYLRVTGTANQPIVFRPIPGERVVLDGMDRSLAQGVFSRSKAHVALDGLYFYHYSGPLIYLEYSDHITITRCFANSRGPGYAGPLVSAFFSSHLTVRNSVAMGGMGAGLNLIGCPEARIEHCVFLRNLIYGGVLVNEPDQQIYLRKSIFTDSLPTKTQVALFEIGKPESLIMEDLCFVLRVPDEERQMFLLYGLPEYQRSAKHHGLRETFDEAPAIAEMARFSLADYEERFGETGSVIGSPRFSGTVDIEPGGELWTGHPAMLFDKIMGKQDLDFADLFTTHPELAARGIGLQPDAFDDFPSRQ